MGVSPGFVSEIEHGRKKPSAEMLFALESRFGVDVGWLLRGGEGPPYVAEASPPYRAGRSASRRPQDIPVYRLGNALDLSAAGETLHVPAEFSGPSVIAARVPDDSMAPTLPVDALVGIDQRRAAVKDGEIYLVALKETSGETLMVRRLYRTRGGVRLRADHERYPDRPVPRKQYQVMGRIVWVLRAIT